MLSGTEEAIVITVEGKLVLGAPVLDTVIPIIASAGALQPNI
jgi:hypothetical protein